MLLTSTSYQLAARLLLTEGLELGVNAVLDTGSGPTLIKRDLLPGGLEIQPIGESENNIAYDLNRGRLRLKGSVRLGLQVGKSILRLFWGAGQNERPSSTG